MGVLTAGKSRWQLVGERDGVLSNREKTGTAEVLGRGKHPWNTSKKLGHVPLKGDTVSDQNAHSMSCKQENQEATVLLKSYNLITVTETWWEGLQNSCAATNDQKLFLRDRQGRKEQAVALCVKKKRLTPQSCLWKRATRKNWEISWMVFTTGHPTEGSLWTSSLTSTTRDTMLTGSDAAERLQSPWHLLGKQHSKL